MNKSFHRSSAILQAILGAANATTPLALQSMDMDLYKLPAYASRGKSGKKPHSSNHKHMAYVRAQRKARRAA